MRGSSYAKRIITEYGKYNKDNKANKYFIKVINNHI